MSKKRKKTKFWFNFVLWLVFGLIWGLVVGFLRPNEVRDMLVPNSYLLFFAPLALMVFFGLRLILKNSRQSLIFSLALITFLILRLNGLGNWLNGVLILGISIGLDIFTNRK